MNYSVNWFKKTLFLVRGVLDSTIFINLSEGYSIDSSVKLRNAKVIGKATIAEGCKLINGVTVDAGSLIQVGRYTSFTGPTIDIVAKIHPIMIGSFCSIAKQVLIQEFNHRMDRLSTYYVNKNLFQQDNSADLDSNGSIEIGNDVWIGAQSIITSGTKIGHGAVIGANSVVTGNIPPYAIAVGSPAKVIKYRFDQNVIELLLKIAWWDWPIEKIKANRSLFIDSVDKDLLDKLAKLAIPAEQ